jgi:vancomycin resistance protein YoaR
VTEERHIQWSVLKSRRSLIIGGCVLGAIVLLYLIALVSTGSGIPRGTTVMGTSIGGMSQAEAKMTLTKLFTAKAKAPITVTSARKTFDIIPADAGLSYDVDATLTQAAEHTYNPIALIGNFFTQRTLDPVVLVDKDSLNAQVDGIATVVDHPSIEPTIKMKGLTPVEIDGQSGKEIDRTSAAASVTQAFATGSNTVSVVPTDTKPTVSNAALATAKTQATQAVSAPVFVTTGAIKAKIGKRVIARSLSFGAENGALVPVLDGAVLHKSVAGALEPVETAGRSAFFETQDGKVIVVPGKVGKGVSDEDLATAVSSVLDKTPPDRVAPVTIGVREPALSTQAAQELGVTAKLSSFTQNFPYAAYRKQNIGEAARRVNGSVVMPGGTFSMNDTIKERTVANGYTVGFVIGQGGIFAQELGGGVSTATTATWTAAFYAGMEPEQVIAHSIYISRYKAGLEATVAWGIFDMKFRNPYDTPVYIQASATSTSVTVSFWGVPVYSDIKAEFGPRRDIKPFKTIYDESDTCLGQGGMEGFAIDVDRVFYNDGVEVKRETITTKYKPSPEVICGKEKKTLGTQFGPTPIPGASGATPAPSKSPSRVSTKAPAVTPGAGDAAPARS